LINTSKNKPTNNQPQNLNKNDDAIIHGSETVRSAYLKGKDHEMIEIRRRRRRRK
jgi:hypothetical protein